MYRKNFHIIIFENTSNFKKYLETLNKLSFTSSKIKLWDEIKDLDAYIELLQKRRASLVQSTIIIDNNILRKEYDKSN